MDAIPELKKVATTDERPLIRATAYWAIGQILGEEARDFINANYDQEDAEVQNEMIKGLDTRRE
ncbi:iron-sulfur cluster-binding protein [Staphylococcus aureus]|nr:iron-sulfur cluster-binding protein [Staphylococcus aureus]CAC6065392.1 iron-sulfur cluster-binding protein [Staphylococcus aureus]CAC6159388.1 iron-sulfur cluster-binding protein [Staphylococcus aureus]CAC6728465.1 iron-sulfur cluster-binding protein [Staphylococcus aureus]CAC8075558.1 iron-sulfur cluster-binding protein [Staphylococcus aureus]